MIEIVLRFQIDLLDLFDGLLMRMLDRITTRREGIRAKWAKLI